MNARHGSYGRYLPLRPAYGGAAVLGVRSGRNPGIPAPVPICGMTLRSDPCRKQTCGKSTCRSHNGLYAGECARSELVDRARSPICEGMRAMHRVDRPTAPAPGRRQDETCRVQGWHSRPPQPKMACRRRHRRRHHPDLALELASRPACRICRGHRPDLVPRCLQRLDGVGEVVEDEVALVGPYDKHRMGLAAAGMRICDAQGAG